MIDTKLTSIEELFRVDKDSGDKKLNRKFIVPNYQREYKWSKDEVEKLLTISSMHIIIEQLMKMVKVMMNIF